MAIIDPKTGRPKQCQAQVAHAAGAVIGSRIRSQCQKDAVFETPDGRFYCAVHAKPYGYVAPARQAAERKEWLAFFTDENGEKDFQFLSAASEKAVRSSISRRYPGAKIDAIVPDLGTFDQNIEAYSEFMEWFPRNMRR